MRASVALLFTAVAALSTNLAFADGPNVARYGGVLAVVKDVQYELVAKPDIIVLYVDDHGKKVDTKGATGKLTLLTGGEKTEIVLEPAGENKLAAKGAFKIAAGTKAVAVVTLAGKPAINARYELR